MTVLYRLFFFASLIVLFVEPASAGVQFTECAFRTGRSASIIIPKDAPKVDGQPLAPGSEIAVFNQDGLCAGVVVWDGGSTALTVWGNAILNPTKQSIEDGEPMFVRIWNAADKEIYEGDELAISLDDSRNYLSTDPNFRENLIYRIVDLNATNTSSTDTLLPATYEFGLGQNYPNPFNAHTQIPVTLPEASDVRIQVYNVLGQEVARPVDEMLPAGRHEILFDASGLASGTYIYRITAGSETSTRTMTLVK